MGRNILRQNNGKQVIPQDASATHPFIKGLKYTWLTVLHWFSKPTLRRTPEPFTLTEQEQHVEDYSRAIQSVMILPYVLILDMVHRLSAQNPETHKKAVDLCCGPGHFTRMLAKYLNCEQVTGVDLSEPMLAKAKSNAEKENLSSKLQYLKSDVTNLESLESNSMDIVSFMDGAHHMNSVEMVGRILKEADRVAKPEGLVIVLDPVRPKNMKIANLYHKIAGEAYEQKGLHHFNKDFYDSILASWSFEEMFEAVPQGSDRKWIQLIPFGFPAFQIIVGLPVGMTRIPEGQGLAKALIDQLIPAEGKADWEMLKMSFRMADQRQSSNPEKSL